MIPLTRTAFDPRDPDAKRHFDDHGWVLTADLTEHDIASLASWVDDIATRADLDGGVLHHREMTDQGPKLCRSENFVPVHDELRELLSVRLAATASSLLGEPAVLYKEKINYKLSGGAGYSPHQDAPAYPFIDTHVSCMVAIDDATLDNGCLEVVSGHHGEVLPMDDRGCVRSDIVERLVWEPVPLPAGRTLWFHSRTPHRSGPNRSDRDRRALYPTYNAASLGSLREDYYAEKLRRFLDTPPGERVTVSLIGDFEGRPVD